jgi:GMC oxidoreductase
MMYTRAAASDYDDWVNVYGNKGWGSMHLIPLLKKVSWSFYLTFYLHNLELFFSYTRQKHFNKLHLIQLMAPRDLSKYHMHKMLHRTSAEVSFLLLRNLIKNVVS